MSINNTTSNDSVSGNSHVAFINTTSKELSLEEHEFDPVIDPTNMEQYVMKDYRAVPVYHPVNPETDEESYINTEKEFTSSSSPPPEYQKDVECECELPAYKEIENENENDSSSEFKDLTPEELKKSQKRNVFGYFIILYILFYFSFSNTGSNNDNVRAYTKMKSNCLKSNTHDMEMTADFEYINQDINLGNVVLVSYIKDDFNEDDIEDDIEIKEAMLSI
ncbi:hypothetical protein CANARDRAFT_29616 [[Candida] arabinofermentans NRRL YB-2248]|uniref:Uncharacterized protein n=1 Tax=[Candida] arabinofermentans NRRL YB-2248 TaxID=983967 RepID=A0A1E4SWK5_9ASCO|nr:hypothetical protein CANARDRAFT_29616 [[Candida] arabinofermentans NRRL YB-2248]